MKPKTKLRAILKRGAKKALNFVSRPIRIAYHTFIVAFSCVFLATVIFPEQIVLEAGKNVISNGNDPQTQYMIHELFPHASWNDLEPCGQHFDEQKEFEKALQCANNNVWPETPIKDPVHTHIPRCYVVKAHSPDVYTKPELGFNFVPIFEVGPEGIEVGAVVGVYQPETRTVYIIENIDAPSVYRHELQHYFLHAHDPATEGGGHNQLIWEKCEAPFYEPSDAVVRNIPTPAAEPTVPAVKK